MGQNNYRGEGGAIGGRGDKRPEMKAPPGWTDFHDYPVPGPTAPGQYRQPGPDQPPPPPGYPQPNPSPAPRPPAHSSFINGIFSGLRGY
jgi:hypothetical protein